MGGGWTEMKKQNKPKSTNYIFIYIDRYRYILFRVKNKARRRRCWIVETAESGQHGNSMKGGGGGIKINKKIQ